MFSAVFFSWFCSVLNNCGVPDSPQKQLHLGDVMYLLYHFFSFFFGREKAEESLLIHETQIRNGKEILQYWG